MRHLVIAVALLVFAGLDVVFVEFSGTPDAALTFAVMSYLVLLLLSGAAGGYGPEPESARRWLAQAGKSLMRDIMGRLLMASLIPVALLLAFLPDLDDPLDPSKTVQLGATFAVFGLLMSMALVGAVLGFLWPKTGAMEAVLVGGVLVVAQSLLSWIKIGAPGGAVQIALYTWMVWVSVCLVGAWVGIALRQFGDAYFSRQILDARPVKL